ncbi:MAG: putative rhamnosyl transferase [Rhodobacteraceae bacterium]|nr:putative rhamnosyl transferase [Paracoccaceae bacterium]
MISEFFQGEDVGEYVQIAGLIRFSYPSSSGDDGFRVRYKNREEQLAKLYTRERMEERLALFENICLHTLRRQTNKNFSLGLLVGEDMPEEYLLRLQNLIKDVPQLCIIALPSLPYKAAIKAAYAQLFDQGKPFRMSFRLDDDDAVAVDYIERLNEYLPYLVMLTNGMNPVCLTFSSGLTVFGPAGDRKIVSSRRMTPLGLGVAVLAPESWSGNVFVTWHPHLHTRMLTIFDPLESGMLRIFHNSNDSEESVGGIRQSLSEAEIESILRNRFALEIDRVLAI